MSVSEPSHSDRLIRREAGASGNHRLGSICYLLMGFKPALQFKCNGTFLVHLGFTLFSAH